MDAILFVDYLKAKLPLVEDALAHCSAAPLTEQGPVSDLEKYLYKPLAHFSENGGKRARPVLALLGAETVGGKPERALSAGIAIELFQSAALIHDDIADEGELRRGEPCLYKTEGIGVATNMGDLALTQVFEVVLADEQLDDSLKIKVLNQLVAMERHTLEGQALDLGWARDERWDVKPADCLYMVESKTAWYSVAEPLYMGALSAGAPESTCQGLSKAGLKAGIVFQIQDDLVNLLGEKDNPTPAKDFRNDITEGKRTLAVVYALEHLDEAQRNELVGLLSSKTTDEKELARAVELIEAGGGLDYCSDLIKQHYNSACEEINNLSGLGLITPKATEILLSMVEYFAIRRW